MLLVDSRALGLLAAAIDRQEVRQKCGPFHCPSMLPSSIHIIALHTGRADGAGEHGRGAKQRARVSPAGGWLRVPCALASLRALLAGVGDAREAMATMGLLCAFALLATPPSSSREVAESKLVEYFNGTLSVPKLSSVAVSKAKIEIDRQTQYMPCTCTCRAWAVRDPASRHRVACEPCSA